jgi:hypothetical protein
LRCRLVAGSRCQGQNHTNADKAEKTAVHNETPGYEMNVTAKSFDLSIICILMKGQDARYWMPVAGYSKSDIGCLMLVIGR